jgi:hypothetical protein
MRKPWGAHAGQIPYRSVQTGWRIVNHTLECQSVRYEGENHTQQLPMTVQSPQSERDMRKNLTNISGLRKLLKLNPSCSPSFSSSPSELYALFFPFSEPSTQSSHTPSDPTSSSSSSFSPSVSAVACSCSQAGRANPKASAVGASRSRFD